LVRCKIIRIFEGHIWYLEFIKGVKVGLKSGPYSIKRENNDIKEMLFIPSFVFPLNKYGRRLKKLLQDSLSYFVDTGKV